MGTKDKPFKGIVRTFDLKGKKKRFHSLSFFAETLHRSPAAITQWEKRGVSPGPIFKMSDGNRWYTEEEIAVYLRLMEVHGIKQGTPIPKEFVAELKSELGKLKAKFKEEGYA